MNTNEMAKPLNDSSELHTKDESIQTDREMDFECPICFGVVWGWNKMDYRYRFRKAGKRQMPCRRFGKRTGQTGLIQWTNLYPGLYYRVTEVRAPNGYLLLDKPVFSGKLSGDKLEASFTVVNTREFTMPKTGSDTMRIITATSTVLYALTTVTMILLLRRKKESWE